ncbi:DNA internalization-related competence protein ComEC/Rec2 [Oceanobacillus piezotolerans]|uniref:DNA internalization-related competence protein ComEC/Rec2 n=1 Tax=Oceanobacillus piezotolerans TaxID=2448030 RepID=A0A498D9M9_9BACI|nr:DNA internalization-related competence protein ComEC/Rec2 [Oceanobacillus piezotolerans]RLL48023.1 DNA internalization-related competence protein ComEC/Rec2 [Oceanobacillus piezotolerans]
MKGYWYIAAFSIIAAVLSVYFKQYLFSIAFIIWLFSLLYLKRLRKRILFVSLALHFIFALSPPLNPAISNELSTPEESVIYGKVVTPPTITEQKLEFTVEIYNSKERYQILYFPKTELSSDSVDAKYGSKCKIIGELERPKESRNPGQFDYRDFLLKKGITHQLILTDLNNIECHGTSFMNRFYKLRLDMIEVVENKLSPYTASWLNSLVLGEDSKLDEDTVELFQRWGLSHIIAISGTHIALFLAFLYFLLVKLNILTKEKAGWLIIFLLPVYAILAGGEPSVWRASIMVVLVISIQKANHVVSPMDIISIVFILFMFVEPSNVFHVGFQLSFIVTASIILSKKWVAQTDNSIMQALKICFIAQMIIIPLQFSYFSYFQPLSIILNLIIIPYFSLLVIPFMYVLLPITILLSDVFLSQLDRLFINLNEIVISFINWVDSVANYPWVSGSFTLEWSIIYYVILLVLMANLEQARLKKAFLAGCMLTALLIIFLLRPYFSPAGTVTMLDIGQGDAFVIELPFRKGVIMVDAGSRMSFENGEASSSVYKQVIKPYLQERGIRKIDALFLTHEDTDHVGSVPYIIEDVKVDSVFISPYYKMTSEELLSFKKNKVIVRKVGKGSKIHIGEQTISVLAPAKKYGSSNSNSLVLYTEIGGLNWLFTGDVEGESELAIAEQYPNLEVEVLKVSHHGSKTSTNPELIGEIAPEVALISVGENNMYGHPSPQVIETLNNARIPIFRTDIHGAVQYKFKGKAGTFYSHLP